MTDPSPRDGLAGDRGEAALVSVGMPVHNGAATLERALASVLGQTYRNLEVVLSDNGSTDDTATIARRIAAEDGRVRYFRQPEPVPAWSNFRFVLEQATGDYFFWAADDDLHSPNYVERLVGALSANPEAALAVTDVVRFHSDTDPASGTVVPPAAADGRRSPLELVRDVILSPCSEFYGVFRADCLREMPWSDFDYGPDHILLYYVRLRGDVVHVRDALFYESIRRSPKRRRLRVEQGFYGGMGRFRMARFAWELAKMADAASAKTGVRVHPVRVFASAYATLWVTLGKVFVYEHAPRRALRLWRQVKPTHA